LEEEFVTNQLDLSTKPHVRSILEETWLTAYEELWSDDFLSMLHNDDRDSIKKYYRLLEEFPDSMKNALDTLKRFVNGSGLEIVQDCAPKLAKRNLLKESATVVSRILKFHDRIYQVLTSCFSSSRQFDQAAYEAFSEFVSKPAGVFLFPEIFNNYVNDVMVGKVKFNSEEDMQQGLVRLVRLVTYYPDKDIFYNVFRTFLGKRLLSSQYRHSETAKDQEKFFVNLLRNAMGDLYTEKFEGMFKDLEFSKEDLEPKFKSWSEENGKQTAGQVSVIVLTDTYWATKTNSDKSTLVTPMQLMPCIVDFQEFYKSQEEKKVLTWLFQLGDVWLDYAFAAQEKERHLLLNMSVTQACICLLFNQQREWLVKNIAESVGLPDEQVILAIAPLLFNKERVFRNLGDNGKGKPKGLDGSQSLELLATDILGLVPVRAQGKRVHYPTTKSLPSTPVVPKVLSTGGKRKVDLRSSQVIVWAEDESNVPDEVMKEREVKMHLALVRILKARGSMIQHDLIIEASAQLERYFVPNLRWARVQVETLIERDFIERDGEDSRLLHYKP